MKEFVVTDESINSYGFRVLTAGIDTKRFKANPVGFFNHNRDDVFSATGYTGPIVRWEHLKVNDKGEMTGTPVFDTEDPVGMAVSRKVENGFIRGASIGISILAMSDAPEDMVKGQKYPTITKSELIEISVVDVPSNKKALALYDQDGKRVELKDETIGVQLSAFKQPPQTTEVALETETNLKIENTMKLKILATMAALSAFLGITHAANTESTETELGQDQLSKIDAELATLAALKATNESLKDDKASADAAKVKAEGELTAANATIVELRTKLGVKPADATTAVKTGAEDIAEVEGKKKFRNAMDDKMERAAGKEKLRAEMGAGW